MKNLIYWIRETSTGRFFIPLGIILLVMSFLFYQMMDQTKSFKKVEATVTNMVLVTEEHTEGDQTVDATYDVTVQYTVDGTTYEESYGEHSGLEVGDKIQIVYNPDNPKEIAQPITIVVPVIMAILGLAALGGGIVSIVMAINKKKRLEEQEESWSHGS